MVAKVQQQTRRCLCGCNGEIGKRATFVPGHDSKLHSRWLMVRRKESKERLTPSQIEYAEAHWQFTPAPKREPKRKVTVKQVQAQGKRAKRQVNSKTPATVANDPHTVIAGK